MHNTSVSRGIASSVQIIVFTRNVVQDLFVVLILVHLVLMQLLHLIVVLVHHVFIIFVHFTALLRTLVQYLVGKSPCTFDYCIVSSCIMYFLPWIIFFIQTFRR